MMENTKLGMRIREVDEGRERKRKEAERKEAERKEGRRLAESCATLIQNGQALKP